MPIDVNIQGTKELTNALVEIFSPVTNLLGTLGDRVRIYRQLSLLRSIKRAREIALEEGLTLKEPPLKFLVPFLEDCSLESPDESELIEMWAKLLASSGSEFKPEHNLFIRMLREMTSSEAKLLNYIVSPKSANHSLGNDYWNLEDDAENWRDPYIYIKLRDSISALSEPLADHSNFDQIDREFRTRAEMPGTVVYFFDVARGRKGEYPLDSIYDSGRHLIEDDFERTSISILKGLGILGDYVSPEFWFGDYLFELRAYFITELGAHFVKACTRLPTGGRL